MEDQHTTPDTGADIEIVKAIQLALMRARDPNRRGQHSKTNGCVEASFEVLAQIPDALKVGLFATPAVYRSDIRFSNGGEWDDRKRDVHGMAIKLFDVPGQMTLDDPASLAVQDFILADNPVFFIRTASDYALFMEDVARSAPLGKPPERFIAHLQQTHPQDVPMFMQFMQKQQQDNPLTATYWSQVPYAFGAGEGAICRYRAVPAVTEAAADGGEPGPDYLRERMVKQLGDGRDTVVFNFEVQMKAGADQDIINNPTVEWDEPFVSVATIRIPAQVFASDERDDYGEWLAYTPWHALVEHRPLGEVNAIRKTVYLASQELRNGPGEQA